MPYQTINVGTNPNDGTGDTLRNAFIKCNSNFTGSLSGSGIANYIPQWKSVTALTSSAIYQSGSSNIGINNTTFNSIAPETLNISCSNFNAIGVYGTQNSYIQVNVTNFHQGATASADLVATNNLGNEGAYYINVGINGSNYTSSGGVKNFIGTGNDAYLYNTGSNLYIGNITANGNVYFFAGGYINTSSVILGTNGLLTATLGQAMPYSSSIKTLTPIVATGSQYLLVSSSTTLQYIYNGSRWTSCSMA